MRPKPRWKQPSIETLGTGEDGAEDDVVDSGKQKTELSTARAYFMYKIFDSSATMYLIPLA